jgi:outer membrane protein assembly factor BamB
VSPAIGADGTIYIGAGEYHPIGYKVLAIRPDGTVKWAYEVCQTSLYCDYATPAIGGDGTIYVGVSTGVLYAINADGTRKWEARIPIYSGGSTVPSPTIAPDGTIYIGGTDGLYAVSPAGGIRWKYRVSQLFNSNIVSSPAVDQSGTIYFTTHYSTPLATGFGPAYVFAINPDGTRKWQYTPPGNAYTWFDSSPAIGADGTIYVAEWAAKDEVSGSRNEGLLALTPEGTLKWKFLIGSPIASTPAIAKDGTIYVAAGGGDQSVYAINPDGTLRWFFYRGGFMTLPSSPAISADGTMYIGSDDGNVYAIGKAGGGTWSYSLSQSLFIPSVWSPVIGLDGTIFVAAPYVLEDFTVRRKLYAIGDKASGATQDDLAGLNGGAIWYTLDRMNWHNVPGYLTSLAVGDFDRDGHDDLAGLNATDGSIWVTTDLATWKHVPGYLTSLVVGDFGL